jgi:hypothetical protein
MQLTATAAAIYAPTIAKCGCASVRDLFWMIDRGPPHPDPLAIDSADLRRAGGIDAAQIAAPPRLRTGARSSGSARLALFRQSGRAAGDPAADLAGRAHRSRDRSRTDRERPRPIRSGACRRRRRTCGRAAALNDAAAHRCHLPPRPRSV